VPVPPPRERPPDHPKRLADFPPDQEGKHKRRRYRLALEDFLAGDAGAPSSNSSNAGSDERQVVLNDRSVAIIFPADTNEASERLVCRLLRRNITGRDVSRLIQQGADASLRVRITRMRIPKMSSWRRRSRLDELELGLIDLAIDDPTGGCPGLNWQHTRQTKATGVPVVLPMWPSRKRQKHIVKALIAGGARGDKELVTMAFHKANLAALDGILSDNPIVDEHILFFIDEEHTPCPPEDVYEQYFDALLPCIRRLLKHKRSLATDFYYDGTYQPIHGIVDHACFTMNFARGFYELLYEFGAPLNSRGGDDWDDREDRVRPIDQAYLVDEPRLLEFLCKHLPASVLMEEGPQLMRCFSRDIRCALEEPLATEGRAREKREKTIEMAKEKTRLLLRAGAPLPAEESDPPSTEEGDATTKAIERRRKEKIRLHWRADAPLPAEESDPPSTEEGDAANKTIERQRECEIVKHEYVRILNAIPDEVMNAVNAALRPQREIAALLTHLLPLTPHNDGPPNDPVPSLLHFGPQEAAGIAWRIAALCFDRDTAHQTVSGIQLRSHGRLGHRVHEAMDHFVASAVFHASGNTEVVGGSREADGQVVHAPPLRCFSAEVGQQGRRPFGLREVVHKARLDEAEEYGLTGVIKGFNEHLGDADCQFEWDGLGFVDEVGEFESLAARFEVPAIEEDNGSDSEDDDSMSD